MRSLLVPIALLLASGCMPPVAPQAQSLHAGRGAWRVRDQEWPSSAADDRRAIAAAESASTYVPEVPQGARPPPIVTAPDPQRTPFDSVAALASIHEADVSACVARGAPSGYGHARLTFERPGQVSHVAIDAPQGMSDDATACVGEELAHARVAPFDGPSVSVGASFLVTPTAK